MSVLQFSTNQPLVGSEILLKKIHQRPASVTLLFGHSSVFKASLLIRAMLNQPVAVIDGAMRFNSYTLSNIAKLLHSTTAKKLLEETFITRSFTAFQTEAAITTKLTQFLTHTRCPLVIVLGLLDTYYDEQVKPHECRQSLRRIFQTFRTLTASNIHILLADVAVEHPPAGKEHLFRALYNAADVRMSLQPLGNEWQLREERSNQRWDVITTPSHSSSIETKRYGVNSVEL